MISQKMRSLVRFRTKNFDAENAENVQIDIRQKRCDGTAYHRTFNAMIFPGNIIGFIISKEDAAQLKAFDAVAVQALYTDLNGWGHKTPVVYVEVGELIREGTYGN